MSIDGSVISLAKTISIILLNVAVISGCSTSASKTTASPNKFDPIGTAQAQASDIEYTTPLPYTPKETPINFEPWIKINSHAIQSLDSKVVMSMYEDQFPWKQNAISISLLQSLKYQDDWNALFLLAASQMLLTN